MKCPKCNFAHEVFKFCPFCGVSLVDEEQSSAGGEGPGPPDTAERQESPAVSSRQDDSKTTVRETSETKAPSLDKSSVDEVSSRDDLDLAVEAPARTNTSPDGYEEPPATTEYASANVIARMTETEKEPQPYLEVEEDVASSAQSTNNNLQNDSRTHDQESTSVDEPTVLAGAEVEKAEPETTQARSSNQITESDEGQTQLGCRHTKGHGEDVETKKTSESDKSSPMQGSAPEDEQAGAKVEKAKPETTQARSSNQITESDEGQKQTECGPTEGQGEDVESKKTSESGKSTPRQAPAPENEQAGAEVEKLKAEPDTKQDRSSSQITESEEGRTQSGCSPTEPCQGEDVESTKTSDSGKSTRTLIQGSAPEGEQASAEIKKEEPDSKQTRSSDNNADRKDAGEGETEAHNGRNQQSNEVIEDYTKGKRDTFHLTSEEKKCPTARLVSALAITYLTWKFDIKLPEEENEILLEALSVEVDTEKMTCVGMKEAFTHFEPGHFRELPQAVYSLIEGSLQEEYPTPKWLLALPIYHFLRNDSQPFEPPREEARVGDTKWFGLEGVDIDKLRIDAARCRFETTEHKGRALREMCSACEYSLCVIMENSKELHFSPMAATAVHMVTSCMRLALAALSSEDQNADRQETEDSEATRKEIMNRIVKCYAYMSDAVFAWLKRTLPEEIATKTSNGDYESILSIKEEPEVSPVVQAELFCQVDLEKLNNAIAECFTNAAFTAVENLCQVHAGASVLKETLDEDCKNKITVAVYKLKDVEGRLLDGTLTVEELEILSKFSSQFLELNNTIKPLNQGDGEIQRAEQPRPTHKEIANMNALNRRIAELEAFKEERRLLQKFLGMSEIISPDVDNKHICVLLRKRLSDISTLQQKVDAVIDKLPVSQLCAVVTFDDKNATASSVHLKEEPKVTFFDLEPHIKATLDPLERLQNSYLFQIIWKEQAEEARSRIRKQRVAAQDEEPHLSETTEGHQIVLSIDQVVTDVCQPALKVWEEQRERVETGEITLEDVDKYFGIMGKERDLNHEISKLSVHPTAWVKERADQIRQYHLLGQYIEKAGRVNDVRQSYQLGGDFSSVQTLLDSSDASFKTRPLRSIDDSVFKATSILDEFTEATSEALNAFVLSKPLVEWMRKHTKDTKELKVFADLASISAGETDIEIDRVNMLLSAGIGYGPLIYDLKQKAGFAELMKSVRKLKTYLTQDPNLPKKLRDMKNHLAWLTHVQESHGSVEKSSLTQAEAINAKGIYEIGHINQPKDLHEPLDGVITLRLSQTEGDTDDLQYSVSNLKTLQSKLMLIAGTADKGKEEVERFVEIFNGVIRLGNVYIRLRRTGSVLFDRWTCILFCDPQKKVKARIDFGFGSSTLAGMENDLLTEVTNLAKFMESCLEGWLEHVDFKRGVHPQLNNFTTEQIVVLRRELANALNGDLASSQAIVLLDSVKTLCTANDLKEALDSMKVLDDEMTKDVGGGSEEKSKDGFPITEVQDREALLRKLHNCVEDLSDDMAEAALKVCQKGNFDETLDEAIDWCICNFNNDELVQRILRQTDDTVDTKEQPSTEASLEQAEENDDPSRNVPRLPPLTGVSSMSDLTRRLVTETKDRDETLVEKVTNIWDLYLKSTQFENMKEYLSLEHLGCILQALSSKGDMFRTVLSLYLHGGVDSPLPTYSEVLLCTTDTTTEEIVLLWKRAMTDQTGRIFCLVNIDQLDHDVSEKAEEERSKLMQRPSGCHLVLTCAMASETQHQHQSYIATALEQYRVQQFATYPLKDIKAYLSKQLVQTHSTVAASSLDYQRSSVRVISSDRPGLGKSLYVQRLAQKLRAKRRSTRSTTCYLKVPFHEAVIDVNTALSALTEQQQNPEKPTPTIIHLDVSPLVRKGLDYFLFNLTVLGRVMGKDGKVWLRLPWDLYLIERTSGTSDVQVAEASNSCHFPFVTFLPSSTCRAPVEIHAEQNTCEEGESQDPAMDATLFCSEEFQRPYHYLRHWEAGEDLDRFTFVPGSVVNDHADFLNVVLRHCGIKDPSWAELRHFLSFLNHQLRVYEQSDFCQTFLRDSLPGLRKFVVEFMIIMSKDFATPSLEMADESPSFKMDVTEASDTAEAAEDPIQYHLRRRWENCPHQYLFFNSDHHSMTFLGFHVDKDGNITDPADNSVLQHNVMGKELRRCLDLQRVNLQVNFDMMQRRDKIGKLRMVMGLDRGEYFDPDDSYELTTDNVKKILAIHMRFRCNIPVIIMGETGCGKTRLVRFMCDLQAGPPTNKNRPRNMVTMKLHGGVSAEDIVRTVTKTQRLATENRRQHNIETVLFLDEANTSEAIGLIKEIMCDGTVNGKPLPTGEDSLKIVAAVNPYRRHTETMIRRLEQAGLGYHIRAEQTDDKLGRIPMRQLVYRVQPLPPSMLPLVWDFGQLNSQTERLYIEQMVKRCVSEDRFPAQSIQVVTAVLTASQEFMRRKKNECSFVSLRDVERTLTVMAWFLQMLPVLSALMNEKITGQTRSNTKVTDVCRALVLALGVCYQARLEKRDDYREAIANHFNGQLFKLPDGAKTIEKETEMLVLCQDVFLDQLDTLLPPNIARNTALKENVFMMVVCIELRIPLFLVGKPGSSKSLAKSVVSDAMQGDSAPSDFLKRMKQAHMVSFQCSPLATPESIVKTFHQCSMFQQDKDLTQFVSVVVLDEIGLAEDSPKMPLKTLHPLLEEGYAEEGDNDGNTNALQKKVAFVGISNWALDPAKMNRGIFLSRGVPDNEDLRKSARGICEHDEQVMTQLQTMLGSLADAYTDLYRLQLRDREYFGLRDFYSLIKMVSNFCRTSGHPPSRAQLEHAIKRNFSGRDDVDPLENFRKVFETCADQTVRSTDPDCSPLGLIRASLQSIHSDSEGRYLLILTRNYAALTILQQEMLDPRGTVILFGSSFPQDQEYTQVCRDINRIKVCMETGRTVVLLNLENLYESLYDALNQYYVEMGGQRYVDLGLGTHRVKCRVHKDFRLVVVAEKDIVSERFPIPLINRLEKHFLSVSTILTPAQNGIAKRVDEWAKAFVTVDATRSTTRNSSSRRSDKPADAFIGYHEDLPASVVLRVCQDVDTNNDNWKETVTTHGRLLSRHDLPHLAEMLGVRKAVVQLLSLQQFDTEQQFSRRIRHFLEQTLAEGGLLVVQCDSGDINSNLIACASYTIQAERAQTGNQRSSVVFVIQLPRNTRKGFSGLDGGQWLCYHIDDVHPPNDYSPDVANMLGKSVSSLIKPRVSTGTTPSDRDDDGLTYLCESIDSIHIEDVKSLYHDLKSDRLASSQDGQREPLPQAFNDDLQVEPGESEMEDHLDVATLLRSSVQSAAARLTDPLVMKQRTVDRIDLLLKFLANKRKHHEAGLTFAEVLRSKVALLREEQEEYLVQMGSNWLSQEAASSKAVRQAGTFRQAAWVYLQSAVSPLLAEVIAFFDRNSNLDLLTTKEEWLHQLWLGIAVNDKAINLHYEYCLSPKKRTIRETVPVQTSGYDGQLFQCQLPFSWLIRELVDKLWQDAKVMAVRTSESFQEVLRNTFDETDIGRQISKATTSCRDPAEVMVRYIHDYVLMTHKITTDSEREVRLICIAVEHAVSMVRQRQKIPQAPHITDVHVAVDDRVRGCLSRFSQLVEHWPDQLPTLETALTNRLNMKLDVAALHLALEKLTQELRQLTTAKDKQHWGSKLQSVSLLAEDLFAAYKVNSPEQQQEGQLQRSLNGCRCLLARLRVVKLYLDHVCGADQPPPLKQVQRLLNHLENGPDFKTKPTMKKLEQFLVAQSKQAASEHFAKALRKHQDFRRRSNAFFMDVVSMFCFADDTPPHQEVIHMLLGYIVRKVDDTRPEARTKDFSLFKEDCVDRTPIIRSFLLQLLLRFKFDDVCKHLESYFEGARDFAGSVEDDIEVCIIFVQCMENALSSQVDRMPGRQSHIMEQAARELERAARRCKEFPNIPLMLQLKMIASIRFGLSVTCDVMYIEINHHTGHVVTDHSRRSLRRLFDNVRSLLSDFEAVSRWPKLFIPKYLYKRHGLDTLLSVGQSPGSQWFLPEKMRGNQEAVVPDRFIVHGEAYQRIREATERAIFTNDINELQKLGIPQDKEVLVLLAISTEVTLAIVSPNQNTEGMSQMQQMLVNFSRSTEVIRNKELAERLIQNNNGGHCTKLSFKPNQPPRERSVSALIVHVGTVLATIPSNPLLEPLKALAVEPHKMRSYYLPTMPEDPLPELKKAFANQHVAWYQCPNGHHYVIGNCTRPIYVDKCNCGAAIGGTGHTLLAGNLPGRQGDATSTGHIIGDAQDRPVDPIPERQLSPFATVMTRLVLHAAMLNGANRNPQPFTNFIRPVPVDITDFLWRHVNRDIDDLARVLGRSIDDATLLVHILLTNVSHSKAVGSWNVAWTSTQGRKNWEKAFDDAYIEPLLQNLDSRLQEANRQVDGDHRLIDTSFHRVLHDNTTPPDQLSLENVIGLPEMWQYRPSVSLEHMSRRFVEHQAQFPMLKMFLDNATILSAMCHLPDIIHLITILRTRYHRNIDLTEALTMKIVEFLKSLPEGQQRDECDVLVKRFGDIWTNIRLLLLQEDNNPRLENMDPVIDVQTTSVYHLLPMKEDASVMSCMTAVVLFLVRKNNAFLDYYRKKACAQDDGTLRCWTDVSASNVVSCDPARDLMPLVLSHCNYSLAIGKGTQVGYDFAALEKQLIDRFLCGKCKLVEKCETFQFRQEARDVTMFAALRKQIPQETISMPIQRQIVLESTSLENVCVSLAAVDIAIFFLASAGGDGDKLVGEYLHRVLKMGKASRLHSDKMRNYCRLKHALSLWQLLSVQRARLLLINGQDPFDNVDSSYTKQLEEEQITALENALKNVDVNTLSAELYEFLVVSDDKEKRKPEWSLRGTLAYYLEEKDAPEINGFLSHFPETILLEHACDTWRILANYNQEEDIGN
ncbi:E3 ubiquitin-protein ligase rnf213-alpha-like [Branchiostoma floridae x Branchiostoma japonicum]